MYPKTQNRVHIEEKEMRTKQLNFDFGVTPEQSCIMCHLSSECSGCCNKCIAEGRPCSNSMQSCSRPNAAFEQNRWNNWLYLVATALPELKKFIPKKYKKELKKYDKRRMPEIF